MTNKAIFIRKNNSCRGYKTKNKILHKQWVKKKIVQPNPPPITFLMVHSLLMKASIKPGNDYCLYSKAQSPFNQKWLELCSIGMPPPNKPKPV